MVENRTLIVWWSFSTVNDHTVDPNHMRE